MVTLIADCETDNLLPDLTRLWMLQIGDADTDEVTIYADQPGYPPLAEGAARLAAADTVVFHNGFNFDMPAINRFFPGCIDPLKLFDTLVAARLLDPDEETNSLEAWGERLGCAKGRYTGDFQTFDDELVTYARQDIVVGRKLYQHLRSKLAAWGPRIYEPYGAIWIEMRFAHLMGLQTRNGFGLNVRLAQELDAEFRGEIADMTAKLRNVFPPRYVPVRVKGAVEVITPKRNDRSRGYTVGAPFSRVILEVFNPGSRQQVAERLKELGWKPKKFTDNGGAQVDDAILMALPWPQAQQLAALYAVKKKLEQVSEGKSAWMKWVTPKGTVHGSVNTIGCAPGRCSHSRPNLAQVNKKDLRMREVWGPTRPGWRLVGCDGEGLQARMLASYLTRYDGGAYVHKIISGDKKLKTDEHSSNLQVLPYLKVAFNAAPEVFSKARDAAKTALYCVLFGGQDPKLGRTIKEGCKEVGLPLPLVPDRELGALGRQALFRSIRGFDKLLADLETVRQKRGFLTGLDGRRVKIRSRHSVLVFLMQAGEAAVMKLAAVLFHFRSCPSNGWEEGRDFAFCANVHDEVQLEARPEIAEDVGKEFAACITRAGELLGVRCPLAGSYDVGDTWRSTH